MESGACLQQMRAKWDEFVMSEGFCGVLCTFPVSGYEIRDPASIHVWFNVEAHTRSHALRIYLSLL